MGLDQYIVKMNRVSDELLARVQGLKEEEALKINRKLWVIPVSEADAAYEELDELQFKFAHLIRQTPPLFIKKKTQCDFCPLEWS